MSINPMTPADVPAKKPEPVAVILAVIVGATFLFGGMSVAGLGATNPTVAAVGAWGTLVTGAVSAGLGAYLRTRVVPVEDVLAYVDADRTPVAGEASELPTGQRINTSYLPSRVRGTNPDL